ncbi:uncharacterized protein F4812DRAFT_469242 [Daldinia caldariorum]|uniref:uncharacterized protein n=1 Tax=Daldinia caldariorum TaxID=326644 RepID=UPI00200840D6|nr:uncharacterized protein F4812DRAFT_469242 [Daldinia caldariorum]KAI1470691.1 hypothetical protein F4812DRAFT_469242 [Daldinia caldariorum]
MREQELTSSGHAIKVALEILERSLMHPNFTNAGEVDSLLYTTKTNYERRLPAMPIANLDTNVDMEAVDFDPDHDRGSRVLGKGSGESVSQEINFDNTSLDDCIALLAKELEFSRFISEAGFLTNPSLAEYSKMTRLFHSMQAIPSWSNARDVRNLSKRIIGGFLESTDYDCARQARLIPAAHITTCMREMIT